jgi:hypothetical protein
MAFDQDPPITKSLTKARASANAIYDALVESGVITGNGDAGAHSADAGADDSEPLFPDNGIIDPES